MLRSLRGSYAVVFYDAASRRAVVAGDHFASYSVYHARAGGDVFFASEPELLLTRAPQATASRPAGHRRLARRRWCGGVHDLVRRRPEGRDRRVAADRRRTVWRRSRTGHRSTRRFERASRAELVSGLWDHVESAVGRRLVRGGKTAIMMSGGVDSSTVAAAAASSRAPGDRRHRLRGGVPRLSGRRRVGADHRARRSHRHPGRAAQDRAARLAASEPRVFRAVGYEHSLPRLPLRARDLAAGGCRRRDGRPRRTGWRRDLRVLPIRAVGARTPRSPDRELARHRAGSGRVRQAAARHLAYVAACRPGRAPCRMPSTLDSRGRASLRVRPSGSGPSTRAGM